ncbi:MAG: hypothetical protein LBH88_02640 [Candidatus Methanoplasma sp.]|jgi:hypothetical protein|nr:hypothetical protein [Candidatus Methanoplasma sp.]
MNTCSKTHKITVSMRDDGDMDVKIVSNCKNVNEYASRLTKITMSDITDRNGSRILDPDVSASLSANCLVQTGIINAAWLETGMLSGSLCKRVHQNEIILDKYDSD